MGGPTGCSPLPTGLSALAWDNFFSLVALQTGSSGSIAASASHYFTTALLYSPMATAAVVVVVASACLLCAVGLVRRQKRSLGFLRVFDMFECVPLRNSFSFLQFPSYLFFSDPQFAESCARGALPSEAQDTLWRRVLGARHFF